MSPLAAMHIKYRINDKNKEATYILYATEDKVATENNEVKFKKLK